MEKVCRKENNKEDCKKLHEEKLEEVGPPDVEARSIRLGRFYYKVALQLLVMSIETKQEMRLN